MRLTALVIDDELLAREELRELLDSTNLIDVVGEASNAIEGLKRINEYKPDVVFLDIQMPQITGLELLAMLDPDTMPQVVFVTAYDEFAIQAFEDNAFDYLLKPVEPARLEKTMGKLKRRFAQSTVTNQIQNLPQDLVPETLKHIPCHGLNRILLVPTMEVESVFSDVSGVQVNSALQKATTQLTLKVIEEKTELIRCHRQYLVSLAHIREIKLLENGLAEIVTTSDYRVPVSRRYLKTLKESIGF